MSKEFGKEGGTIINVSSMAGNTHTHTHTHAHTRFYAHVYSTGNKNKFNREFIIKISLIMTLQHRLYTGQTDDKH